MSDTLYGTDDEEATGKVRTCFCKKDVSSEDPNNPGVIRKSIITKIRIPSFVGVIGRRPFRP